MTLQELIEEFRRQVNDEAQPYLWSDEEVLAYAIDAQDVFVRRSGGIADVTVASPSTTRLTDLDLTAGDPYSPISPYILRIRSGRLLTAARDVQFSQESDMDNVVKTDYGMTLGTSFDDTLTGAVSYGILGVRDNYVRWVKVPSDSDTCRLHVFRLPYPRIASQEDPLEVQEQHHRHLLLWMKHLAYSKQDAEARDDEKAEKFEAMAEKYMATASREQQRVRFRPRQVQFRWP